MILAVLVAARLLFIAFMPQVYSKDLYAWLHVIDVLDAGGNPYKDTPVLNWPPFWMQVLFGIGKLAKLTSVSAIHLIQATLVLAEVVTATICYTLITRFFKAASTGVLIAALALNPISILLSCQHCNFDVFAGLWILLFAYCLISYDEDHSAETWLAACFCLGMGIFTKTIPLILSPLLLAGVGRRSITTNIFGSVLLLTPVAIGMGVIYTLAPAGVSEHVLGYRSMGGWYGITGLLNVAGVKGGNEAYGAIAPWLLLLIMLLCAWRVRIRASLLPAQVLVTMLILLVFLPTFGPGYSPPYILWFLPLLPVYYTRATPALRRMMVAGYCIVALTYITEYAFFPSHGAFIKAFYRSDEVSHLCDVMGMSTSQSLIRLPMFLCFVMFFIALLRNRGNVLAAGKK
ncbi:hypothetical protein GCM10023093_18740 [Nemorincola caseinilytica]|uniref:Glycosyltransferase RgtA/B/C/D-like domain-containing protein n=1 Tax=Nemorincola caseinilytica TaxID=2054315 RepID=A0ABP8NE79_9BACT